MAPAARNRNPTGRSRRRVVLLLGLAILGLVAWVLFPVPFVRGLIVGLFAGPALLLGGLVLVLRWVRKRTAEGLEPPPLPVTSWDYDMEVEDLSGEAMAFSRFAGEVLVLNFWATWCAPCVAEMPALERLREATGDLDVHVACVTREELAPVQRFVEKRGIDLPVYRLAGEPPECFRSRGIPATYILDRTGAVVLRHVGAAAWDTPKVVAFVRGLAATPTT